MADSKKTAPRGRRLAHFPAPETSPIEPEGNATAVLDAAPDPETPFDAPAAETPQPKPRKALTFFQRVASIARSDWPDRAKIKAYRLAPIINRLAGSEFKFITIYDQPITEEKLKVDHGSGKYRLYLNYKPPGHKGEAELDSIEVDILDPAFPPNIPPGDWVDDPRNKKWAWARPAGAGQQPQTPQSATDSTLNALGTFMEIQDRITERMQPAPAAPAAPAAAAPAPVDPWAAAEKILNMRSENPMVETLKEMMKASAAATEAERDRAFKAAEAARQREFELQKQLLDAKTGDQGKSKDVLSQIFELASDDGKLEKIKKVAALFGFGTGSNGDGAPVRSGRTTGFDIAREIISSPFGANLGASLGQGAGMLLASLAQRNAAPAQPPNGQPMRPQLVTQPAAPAPSAVTGETTEQRIGRIGATITEPMLYQFFLKDAPGDEFAQYMNAMWPEDFEFMKSLGAENIVSRYQQFPPAWQIISPRAPAFTEFITEFCSYDPNEDEAPAGPPADDGIVDLTAEGEN